jgi:hypothetical protein
MLLCACGAGGAAQAQTSVPAAEIPDLVTPTNGINLGSSSFDDGFGPDKPGLTLLGYARYNFLNKIAGPNGNGEVNFQDPSIQVRTLVTQFSYLTPIKVDSGMLGFDVLVPVTSFSSSFGAGGRSLRDNGFGLSDVTVGPFIQFRPIMRNGRPVASVRAAFDVVIPTGKFSRLRDLNQGSGYWSLDPYVAFTVLPQPNWEISGRVQYLYNFETDRIANPPTIPGIDFKTGQAGQVAVLNLASSVNVDRRSSIGINGYFVQQVTKNQIDGIKIPDSERQSLYIGPGFHLDRLPVGVFNFNVYIPVVARNDTTGPQINLQFIRPF